MKGYYFSDYKNRRVVCSDGKVRSQSYAAAFRSGKEHAICGKSRRCNPFRNGINRRWRAWKDGYDFVVLPTHIEALEAEIEKEGV